MDIDKTGRIRPEDPRTWIGTDLRSLGEKGAMGWNTWDARGLGIGNIPYTTVADGYRIAEAARRQWCRSNQAGEFSVQSVA